LEKFYAAHFKGYGRGQHNTTQMSNRLYVFAAYARMTRRSTTDTLQPLNYLAASLSV